MCTHSRTTLTAKSPFWRPGPIDRIEPPFWWTGFEHKELQIMIHGHGTADFDVSVDHPAVEENGDVAVGVSGEGTQSQHAATEGDLQLAVERSGRDGGGLPVDSHGVAVDLDLPVLPLDSHPVLHVTYFPSHRLSADPARFLGSPPPGLTIGV